MKPLVLFSSLAVVCAGGLLALSYEGWRDQPSALTSLSTSTATTVAQSPATEEATTAAVPQGAAAPAQQSDQQSGSQPEKTANAPAASIGQEAQPKDTGAETGPVFATFDMVRVEEDGSAVLAGRANPGSKVRVLVSGKAIGEVEASERGEWVFIPDAVLEKGAHQVQLEETTTDGQVRLSEQTIALTVPDKSEPKPLIVLSETSKPSKVLQKPEAPAAAAETEGAKADAETAPATTEQAITPAEPETKVAAGEPATTSGGPETKVAGAESAATAAEPETKVISVEPAARRLTVDVVDYDDAGRTTFSGKSRPGGRVRVYVNDRFAGETVAGSDGSWAMAAAREIEPGSHSLRTDQVGDDGKVGERIELPFFRESSERIASLQTQREEAAKAEAPKAEPTQVEQEQVEQERDVSVAAAPATTASGAAAEKPEPVISVQEPEEKAEPEVDPEVEPAKVAAVEAKPNVKAEQPPSTGKVVIQPGNSLWQISRVIYGKGIQYTVIYEANRNQIRNPNRIYPGQIFETPGSTAPESIDPACRQPLAECQ
jgi:nucleoid-associated protein YgaU